MPFINKFIKYFFLPNNFLAIIFDIIYFLISALDSTSYFPYSSSAFICFQPDFPKGE